MTILTHTIQFSQPVAFTDHIGVSFLNETTGETATGTITVTEASPSNILSYTDVTWITDPVFGDAIKYLINGLTNTYQNVEGALVGDVDIAITNCAIAVIPPSAITDFVASDDEVAQITMTWSDATGDAPITYNLYDTQDGLIPAGNIVSPFVYTVIAPHVRDFFIRAVNAGGATDSNIDSGTTN